MASVARGRFTGSVSSPTPDWRTLADFASPQAKLVIELDGGQHALRTEADEARSAAMNERGYRVIRFWNGDVMDNLAAILTAISTEVARLLPPHPPRR